MSKREIPRKFQHPLTFSNFSLRDYNGEALWGSTGLRFYGLSLLFGSVEFLFWKRGAEGLVEVLWIFKNEGVSWEADSTGQQRGGSVQFRGITGGAQDFGVKLKY